MMESKELFDTENILCPYCNAVLVDVEENDEYKICSHTIFIATDAGFEFIRDDYENSLDLEPEDSNYDKYTENLPVKGIRLVQYASFPGFLGVYWGFTED